MFSAQVDEGLELRLLEPHHAEALFNLIDRNRDHLGTFLTFAERTKAVKDAEAYLQKKLEQFSRNNGFSMGIWVGGELAGTLGLNTISSEFRMTELGYWLGAEYEGRGAMTKACRYLCAHLFEERNFNRIEIRCSEENTRSRAIPERLGFTLEGKLRQMGYTRDGLTDYLVYGLLKDEWQKGST